MVEFNNEPRPKSKEGKSKKEILLTKAPYEGRELTLNTLKSGTFPIKAKR